jgi:hypothetical protein
VIGSATPLTGAVSGRAVRFTASRELRDLGDTDVLQAHRIGDDPVLPATFGLGWLVNVTERAHPGLRVVECRDFSVHKGIVFTGERERAFQAEIDSTGTVVRARVVGAKGRPHYSGTLTLAAEPLLAQESAESFSGEPEDASPLYRDGALFHGPRLRGIRRVLRRSGERSVFECRLADDNGARASYGGALHRPVLADLLLQAACLQSAWHTGLPCLPLGIGRVEFFAPLPDDTSFVVIADSPCATETGTTVNVAASTMDGGSLSRMSGVITVGSPELSARFARNGTRV